MSRHLHDLGMAVGQYVIFYSFDIVRLSTFSHTFCPHHVLQKVNHGYKYDVEHIYISTIGHSTDMSSVCVHVGHALQWNVRACGVSVTISTRNLLLNASHEYVEGQRFRHNVFLLLSFISVWFVLLCLCIQSSSFYLLNFNFRFQLQNVQMCADASKSAAIDAVNRSVLL